MVAAVNISNVFWRRSRLFASIVLSRSQRAQVPCTSRFSQTLFNFYPTKQEWPGPFPTSRVSKTLTFTFLENFASFFLPDVKNLRVLPLFSTSFFWDYFPSFLLPPYNPPSLWNLFSLLSKIGLCFSAPCKLRNAFTVIPDFLTPEVAEPSVFWSTPLKCPLTANLCSVGGVGTPALRHFPVKEPPVHQQPGEQTFSTPSSGPFSWPR